jgi:hypothetical protein
MTLRLVADVSADVCQMKMINDDGILPTKGTIARRRFGNSALVMAPLSTTEPPANTSTRVLRVLYSEHVGPYSVILMHARES